MTGRVVRFVVLCLLISPLLLAQDSTSTAPTPVSPSPNDPPLVAAGAANPTPLVVKAEGFGPGGTAGLGHRLTLTIRNFKTLLDAAGSCSAVVLFINDRPMYGTKPISCEEQSGRIHYVLDRDPDDDKSDAVWHAILGKPKRYMREVSVSVGPNDQFLYPSSVKFNLFVIPRVMFYVFLLILVVAVGGFIYLARRTSIIRSPVVAPPGAMAPYSLSRFQMAWWFFLVIAGYVFMWMVTGELDTITESILALIGIGAGTAVGAAVIDAPPSPNAQPSPPPPPSSKSFFTDVLTDDQGNVGFHRFQMLAWTIILGVIFIVSVWEGLSMPEFSATLLGLMGLSSGTYLGFKLPEKKNDSIAAGTDPATNANPPAAPPPAG
jgi:hypothetical protein